jgi:hypothetical protein
VFHGFTSGESEPRHGVLIDWIHQMYGAIGFTTEVWNIAGVCGIDKDEYLRRLWERPEEFELKILAWNDSYLSGKGYMDWTPFDHPQLGKVEIGGWKTKFVRQNPPHAMLEEECLKNCLFTIKHCMASPLVKITDVRVTEIGECAYKVSVTVENQGFLPTNITEQAIKVKVAQSVRLIAKLPGGAAFVSGQEATSLGHIDGVAGGSSGYFMGNPSRSRVQTDYVVKAQAGSEMEFTVVSEKGGTDRKRTWLP